MRHLKCVLAGLVILGALFGAGPAQAAPPETGGSPPEGAPYDPDHLLVAFQPGTPPQSRAGAHAREGGRVDNRFDHLNLDVVRVREGEDPAAVAQRYRRNPAVAYAHPNWEVHLDSIPNDVLFEELWGVHNVGQTDVSLWDGVRAGNTDADIDAPEGWTTAFPDNNFPSNGGVRVGVLDTGIDRAHVEFADKALAMKCATAVSSRGIITEGTCSDDNGHGTHVAGTIAAAANNGVGVAGVAPNAELAVFKALNGAGVGFYADVIAGIHWLHTAGDTTIINMSIGGPKDEGLSNELSEASAAGALLIAAAGNDGDDTMNYPAAHADVVSVAATNARDERAKFSNCNRDVELAAPGVGIWSTTPGNTYAPLDGTSMATPHVSGVASMIWSQDPTGWTARTVRDRLTSTVDDLGDKGRDTCFGYGRVNLHRALGGTVAAPSTADPGSIAGKVSDASTKSGIGGAVVDCGTNVGQASTGSDGSYNIADVPVGTHTCTASATGYRPKSQSVTVESNKTTTANFSLRKR